jgi:putative two-component system response regulator
VTAEQPIVLIADDSITNLHVLNNILRPHYRVKATRSGLRAVEIAARDKPHAILLDVMMPDLDGPEVCRRIKSDPDLAHIPVLFVTGSADAAAVEACMAAGGAGLLTKPVEARELLETVDAQIGNADADADAD